MIIPDAATRRRPRLDSACAVLLVLAGCAARPATAVSDRPGRIIVIDTHSDCTQAIVYGGIDFAAAQPDMQVDLPKMRAGGLHAEFFSIFVGPWQGGRDGYYAEALKQFDALHAMIRANGDIIAEATSAAEIRRNAARGRISALFGVEGGHALLPGSDDELIEHLRTFHARGARYMTLTWSIASPIGGSSGDDSDGQGLTDVGRRIIDEMERLGMIVDVSHVSDPLFWDVIRYARKPVLASHSSARELANVPRNLSDPMLRAIARNGGAVCVNFGPAFLDRDYFAREQELWKRVRALGLSRAEFWRTMRAEAARLTPVPLSRLVDHIEHVARVAGIDHVCLGSDFDGIPAGPAGLEDVSKLPALIAALRARGYGAAELEKILGGNVLRVLSADAHRQKPPAGGSPLFEQQSLSALHCWPNVVHGAPGQSIDSAFRDAEVNPKCMRVVGSLPSGGRARSCVLDATDDPGARGPDPLRGRGTAEMEER